jgi:hypothetical protein
VPDLGATTAKAAQPTRQARQPYEPEAPQYPPAREYFDTHDLDSGDYATRRERDLESSYDPDDEQPVVAPPVRHAPRYATPEEEYERKTRGRTILPVVLVIFAGVVAATYWQWSAITEFYRNIGSKPQSSAGQENVVSATQILGAGSAGARQDTSVRPGGRGRPNRTRRGTARSALRRGPE